VSAGVLLLKARGAQRDALAAVGYFEAAAAAGSAEAQCATARRRSRSYHAAF
jgi:hypothetical protein